MNIYKPLAVNSVSIKELNRSRYAERYRLKAGIVGDLIFTLQTVINETNVPECRFTIELPGSAQEKPGLAHLAEHLMVKELMKLRSKPGLYRVGINGYTSAEKTVIRFSSPHDRLPQLLEIVFRNNIFEDIDPKVFEFENLRVIDEICTMTIEKSAVISMFFQCFKGTFLAHDIVGDLDGVQDIEFNHLMRFIKSNWLNESTTRVHMLNTDLLVDSHEPIYQQMSQAIQKTVCGLGNPVFYQTEAFDRLLFPANKTSIIQNSNFGNSAISSVVIPFHLPEMSILDGVFDLFASLFIAEINRSLSESLNVYETYSHLVRVDDSLVSLIPIVKTTETNHSKLDMVCESIYNALLNLENNDALLSHLCQEISENRLNRVSRLDINYMLIKNLQRGEKVYVFDEFLQSIPVVTPEYLKLILRSLGNPTNWFRFALGNITE